MNQQPKVGSLLQIKLKNGRIGLGKLLKFKSDGTIKVQWYYNGDDIANDIANEIGMTKDHALKLLYLNGFARNNWAVSSETTCVTKDRVVGSMNLEPIHCYNSQRIEKVRARKSKDDPCGLPNQRFAWMTDCETDSSVNELVNSDSFTDPEAYYSNHELVVQKLNLAIGYYNGQTLNNIPHGVGEVIYNSSIPNWDQELSFKGEFRDGLPNGFGQITYIEPDQKGKCISGLLTLPTSSFSEDNMEDIDDNDSDDDDDDEDDEDEDDDEMVGGDSFKDDNSQIYQYVGQVVNGKPDGYGVLVFPRFVCESIGDHYIYNTYRGQFKNGFRHGQGELKYGYVGIKYTGEFQYNRISGAGTLTIGGRVNPYDPSIRLQGNHPMIDNDPIYLQELLEMHHKYVSKLGDNERFSIAMYTGSGYGAMNGYLRNKALYGDVPWNQRDKQVRTWVSNFTKVIKNAPPTIYPLIVYRGIDLGKNKSYQLGDQFNLSSGSYVSTSFNIKTSQGFTGEDCCLFAIYLPAGIRGLYFNIREDEFILNQPGPTVQVFKFPGESVPVKVGKHRVYRVFCVDCEEVYGIKQKFRTDLQCYVERGCYKVVTQS